MRRSLRVLCSVSFLFIISVALVTAGDAVAADDSQDWYLQRATIGETILDSKEELTRRTLKLWEEAGFCESPNRPFPKFIKMDVTDWSWDDFDEHEYKDFEFNVRGLSLVYFGIIDKMGNNGLNSQCRIWTVDGKGNRTAVDLNVNREGVLTLTEKRVSRHPGVFEFAITLPSGTENLVIEDLEVDLPTVVCWVDTQSRIEFVAQSLEPFGELSRLIEYAIREDPKISQAGSKEVGTKICAGPYCDYTNLFLCYCQGLPVGQKEVIKGFVKSGMKVDRKTLLCVRDVLVGYYATLEPKVYKYKDLRLGAQVREFYDLIEATEGMPKSRAMLPRLAAMRDRAEKVEQDVKLAYTDAISDAERLLAELTQIKTVFDLECRIKLAHNTLDYVQKSKSLPAETRKLAELESRVAKAGPDEMVELLGEVKQLRREIILQHPDLQFEKLLLCKNPPPRAGHMCDQYLGRHSKAGKGLYVVEDWLSDQPKETCITEDFPEGYYHHPDLSYDGKRVAFAFCDMTSRENLKWRHWIYEAAIDGSGARQLTGTLADPLDRVDDRETVVIEDWDPCYLPDGRIAFVSTRSQSYGRCHGGRYVPAFLLYTMNGDGSDIRQASYGEANEWDPAVLNDGRIVFTRWDYINRHDTIYQGLWTTYPDGTRTAHYYGSYSPSPCMTADTQPIPGSSKVVCTATDHHGYTHGSIVIVDVSKGEDDWEPLQVLTPEIPFPEAKYDSLYFMSEAPQPSIDSQRSSGLQSRATAMAPYPINDTLFLCSYKEQGRYHVYLIDTLGGRELIYDKDEVSAAIPVLPRKMPRALPSALAASPTSDTGTLVIQNVYQNRHVDEKNPIEPGSIKSLRVNLIIPQPTRVHYTRGAVSNEVIKRPLGTVPVNPDGSVALEVPAGRPLQLQTLDENGLAVMTMRSFIYLHSGETQTCVGCHEQRSSSPISFPSKPPIVHRLRPTPGVDYDDEAFSFVRTVQPVLDRYCIGCHGLGEKTADGRRASRNYIFALTLNERLGDKKYSELPDSYKQLVSAAGPRLALRNRETKTSTPRDYFAATSKLPQMLIEGHNGLDIDRDSLERIITWLDLNSQCYGTYLPNREEQRLADPAGEAALRAYVKQVFGEALAAQPLGALVNPKNLEESRILKGPLAEKAGGWATIDDGYLSTSDPKYVKMRELAENAYQPLPFHDIAGTCGRDPCICGNCWIREMVDENVYRETLQAKLQAASDNAETQ